MENNGEILKLHFSSVEIWGHMSIKTTNIDFLTVIKESSFFGFHIKIRKFDTFSILFLGQRLF